MSKGKNVCFKGVSRLFRMCFKGVSKVFQNCLMSVSRKFQPNVINKLQARLQCFSSKIVECFEGDSGSFKRVSRALQRR